jgi:uncharacterized membrane protein
MRGLQVFGALLGFFLGHSVTGNFSGGLLGAVAGFVLAAVSGNLLVYREESERRFAELESALEKLKQQLAALYGSDNTEPTVTESVEAKEPPAAVPHQEAEPAESFTPPPLSPDHALLENQEEPRIRLSHASSAPRALEDSVLNLLTNGITLTRVGILVLIIGLAFLVQYAASQGYLSLELRLAASALGGLVLTGLGWRLRFQRPVYALTLQGGGIGIMYLTVFASFQLYGLLPGALAFGLLVLFTALAAFLAVLQDARNLAILSVLGGFLAPALVSTGQQGSHLTLFGYYLVLNLGILTIAWFKAWRLLNLLGFVFTFIVGAVWGGLRYQPALFSSTEPFLILFFLLYLAVVVLHAYRQPPRLDDHLDNTLILGLPIITFFLQGTLVHPFAYGLAWSSLGLALLYLASAWMLFLRPTMRLLAEAFLGIGLIFAALTLPFALDAFWTGAGWALLGAGLVFFGLRRRRLWLRLGGMMLLAAAALALLFGFEETSTGTPFALSSAVLGLSSLLVAYLLQASPQWLRTWERKLGHGSLVFGLLWWGLAGLTEMTVSLAEGFQPNAYLAFLTLTAAICTFLSPRLKWPALHLPALALLPLMAGILLWASAEHPFAFAGWLVWPLAFVAYYWILRQSVESADHALLRFAHAASLWLLTIVAALELGWLSDTLAPGSTTWSLLAYSVAPILLMVLMTSTRMRLPSWLKPYRVTYLTLGLTPLAVATWLWAVNTNFLSSGNAAPFPYLPLLNPFDLAQALALIALILWYRQLVREVRLDQQINQVMVWLIIGLGILWPSAMMARAVHHWLNVPFAFDDLFGSVILQTGLSIFWTVYALVAMLLATRKELRIPWLLGASLLGLVMVKLFAVDLAQVGTIARIVSFVGVGLLLLLLAYLAPVPPKAKASPGVVGSS